MKLNLQKYFKREPTPHYGKGSNKKADNKRKDTATQQVTAEPIPLEKVVDLVDEFLEALKNENIPNKTNDNNMEKVLLSNGIKIHSPYCSISELKEKYPDNIVWLKFTKDGYLGVVAKGYKINFDDNIKSGKLVNHVNKEWDKTFVIIFPLTPTILQARKDTDIKRGIGNYLKDKGVPIIDFYSHNYF